MWVVTLLVMFLLAPVLAAVVLAGAALYGLLRWVSYAPLRQASSEAIIWAARRDSHFLETMRGIKTIKLFNGQRDRRAHWLNLLVETVNRQLTTQRLELLFQTANALVLGVLGILVIWLAARMIMANTFSIGLMIAFIAYEVSRGGRAIELTPKEYALLRYLMENAGTVLSRPQILSSNWGYGFDPGTKVVDVYIRYVRKKVDEGEAVQLIHTIRGAGYSIGERP